MSTTLTTLIAALTALALSAPAAAQDRLETTGGRIYEGSILSSDDKSVEFQTGEGTTLRLPLEGLTPISRYRVRRAALADGDGPAQLALAEWCVDAVLYPQARIHYRRALDADAALSDEINASLKAARKQASEEVLQRAEGLAADGKLRESHELLTRLLQELPLEPASQKAAQLLAEETLQRKQAATALSGSKASSANAPTTRGGAANASGGSSGGRFSEETHKTLGSAVELYKKVLDKNQTGLTTSNQSSSIKSFEAALKDGDRAKKAVEKVRKANPDAAGELAEAMTLLDSKIIEATVDSRLHIADAYMLRGSYKQASDVLNAGLAQDPQNALLMRARERATMAASNNDLGWAIGGRRRG